MSEAATANQELEEQAILIERARPEDAEAMLKLKQAAWLQSYPNEEHGVTVDDVHKMLTDADIAAAIPNWQKAITDEKEDGDRLTFVAKISGKVVGYTSPGTIEGQRRIGAMYVDPVEHRKGAGGLLIHKATEWLGRDQDIYLHVVCFNDPAIGFYEHFGFHKTGKEFPEEIDEKGAKVLAAVEMVLKAN